MPERPRERESRRLLRRLLEASVEEKFLRDSIFRSPPSSSTKLFVLNKFGRAFRSCLDEVIVTAEIVEGSILVAKNLERAWSLSDIVVIGLDPDSGFIGFDRDVVRDGVIGTFL